MASLVLGAVGAGIGWAIGPATFMGMSSVSIGWSIGSTLGSLLESKSAKQPTQYGPRLGDLKVQSSTYGQAVPRVYGSFRVAGNMIWSLPIKETQHKTKVSAGGKGGGKKKATQITYTYSQTFAIAICEGPIVGVRRIWANGELIYNVSETASIATLVASNQAASGIAIYTGSETQVANSTIQADVGTANCPAYRGTAYVVFSDLQLEKYGNRTPNIEFEVVASGAADEWITHLSTTAGVGGWTKEYDNGLIYYGDSIANPIYWDETIYDLDGNIVQPKRRYTATTFTYEGSAQACRNMRGLYYGYSHRWLNPILDRAVTISSMPAWAHTAMTSSGWTTMQVQNTLVLIANDFGTLRMIQWPIIEGMPSAVHSLETVLLSVTSIASAGDYADADGNLYFLGRIDGSADYTLYQFSMAGALIDWWDCGTLTVNGWHKWLVEDGVLYNIAASDMYAVRLDAGNVGTLLWSGSSAGVLSPPVMWIPGIYWSQERIYRVGPPITSNEIAVSTIVADLCARTGVAAYNTAALTDTLTGYALSARGPARGAIEPLMGAFYFDAVEVDGTLKFVKRGGSLAATIDEDELGAHEWGADQPDTVLAERTQDVELPDEVTLNYMDRDAAYQVGTQYSRRLIGSSRTQQLVSVAMALSASKAKNIADVLIYNAWQGRMGFSFATGPKYSYLVPSDVVAVVKNDTTYTVRITTRDEQGGVIGFGAVLEDLQIYNQASPAPSIPVPSDDVALDGPTQLLLLDIPLLRDIDAGYGMYSAAHGYTAGWPGGQIFKSADGTTWAEFGNVHLLGATAGFASTALANFTQNLFDETNSVTVALSAGTLSSVSEADVLNGANAALLGDEVIQFKTATLVSGTTWTLTGLLRGRRGTEWARSTHAINERFILLEEDTIVAQPMALGELGLARTYRGVTFGGFVADAVDVTLTYAAVALKPYAPVLLGGGRDAAGNITLNWVRRGRIAGEWTDYADVPLGEDAESYEIEIWTAGYATLKRTLTAGTTTVSYTSAQQTTDFGSNQATVYCRVYQLSASVGRGYKLEGTV